MIKVDNLFHDSATWKANTVFFVRVLIGVGDHKICAREGSDRVITKEIDRNIAASSLAKPRHIISEAPWASTKRLSNCKNGLMKVMMSTWTSLAVLTMETDVPSMKARKGRFLSDDSVCTLVNLIHRIKTFFTKKFIVRLLHHIQQLYQLVERLNQCKLNQEP